jgi:4'-phosphopantetheinyl transferase
MIRWLVQSVVDHPDLAAGRPPAGLLSPAEQERYAGYLNPKRRRDWLLGRWTAKRLIQAHYAAAAGFHPALDSFTVVQDPEGAPYVVSCDPALGGSQLEYGTPARLPLAISISHSHGYAFCAVCCTNAHPINLGADLELVEPRGTGFVHDYFTDEEQHALHAVPPALSDLLVTATWSAKESVLKALRLGLRVDTRTVQCIVPPAQPRMWSTFSIDICGSLGAPRVDAPSGFTGWWRVVDNRLRPGTQFVLTLVAQGCTL